MAGSRPLPGFIDFRARIPESLKAQFERTADASRRTISGEAQVALEFWVACGGKPPEQGENA